MKNIKIDEKLLKVMGITAGGIILFIIIIALVASCNNTTQYTIDNIHELEAKLISLAQKYYDQNEAELPHNETTTDLSIDRLVEAKMIKPLNKIIENGENCTGKITVFNNNGYYLYIPKINCGALYNPQNLSATLTNENNLVTSGEGLYRIGSEYVFRGENVNNYLMFANKTWLILRIYDDGTMKIMETTKRENTSWDNRYNIQKNSAVGINDYISNDIDSRIKAGIKEIYQSYDEFSDNDFAHILKQSLCIGKRSINDTINDGSIECAQTLDNQYLGLLAVYEFLQASLDPNCKAISNPACTNYNYLLNGLSSFWTLTADKDSSYKVYKISNGIDLVNASNFSTIKVTALLMNDLLFSSGDGSFYNPYQLITSPTIKK